MDTPTNDDQVAENVTSALREALQARHADTLGGQLACLEDVAARSIEIVISRVSATTRAGQHLAFHLANVLGRMEGVIQRISVRLSDDSEVQLLPGIDPRHPSGGEHLTATCLQAAALAAPHRVTPVGDQEANPIRVAIGLEGIVTADVYAAASEWTAFVGRQPGPECDPGAWTPFGAHAGAAFAAAEVFRMARARGGLADGPDRLYFSTWAWAGVPDLAAGEPPPLVRSTLETLTIPAFTVVGVGAVGGAFLLTLWAAGLPLRDSVILDGDSISTTNLNRYVLFGLCDVGEAKALRAAELLSRCGTNRFTLTGLDQWWAEYRREHTAPIDLLISAVDKNTVRYALQDALPRLIYGGSTNGMRAEVNRYELAHPESRCLKCHNPPELVENDRELHARLLALDETALQREAEDRGVAPELLRRYVEDLRSGGNGCAILGGSALEKLRHSQGEGEFAVSFVSALAGTLLAAQVVREASGAPSPLLEPTPRGNFQLWRPAAAANTPRSTPVDEGCWCTQAAVREAYSDLWPSDRPLLSS